MAITGQFHVITTITTLAIKRPTTPGTIGPTAAVGGAEDMAGGAGIVDIVDFITDGTHTMHGDIIIMATTTTVVIMADIMVDTTADTMAADTTVNGFGAGSRRIHS